MARTFITVSLAIFATSGVAHAALPLSLEEARAREEEKRIIASPIAGIENSRWFDYRINVTETQKELTSDLRDASDSEDLRDAWDEYARELRHERIDYVEDMAERGYRTGYVIIDN